MIFNFNLALTISVSLIITLIYIISIYNTTFCPDTILAASPPDWACNPTQPVPEVNPGVEDAQAECLCNPISQCFRVFDKNKSVQGLVSKSRKGGTLYFLVDFSRALKTQFC